MDNASKALIIAGSVLIAVLIVSLGIAIFTSAAGVAEQGANSVNNASVSAFNGQFEKYFGRKRSYEQTLELCRLVEVNNLGDNPFIYCTSSQWFYEKDAKVSNTFDITGHYGDGGYLYYIEIQAAAP